MVVGAIVRIASLEKGVDSYTANIIFWCVSILSIFGYALIVLILDGVIRNKKILPQKSNSKTITEDFIPTENIEKIIEEQQNIIDENTSNNLGEIIKDNFVAQLPATADVNLIRKTQQQKKLQNESEKLQIALDYTRNQFALYVTDEDLDSLCNAVSLYSKKEEISHHFSVRTSELLTLDLYHFGWNIWNHFNVSNQEKIADFLKRVFVELHDIDLKTIKSHLKDDEKKGIIKIQNQLTD